MNKFDPDYAIFGALGGEISVGIGETKITYVNKACTALFKDFRDYTIVQIINEIAGSEMEGGIYMDRLVKKGSLSFEGKIGTKSVKFHSRVIEQHKDNPDCACVQAAIMDISNSVTLKRMLYDTSEALKRAAMAADEDTGQHVIRINHYARGLADLAGYDRAFQSDISRFAQLHDIGKIRVAEIIRLPRRLTAEEFDLVKGHAEFGASIVANLDGLEMAYNIALDHHEKWDGSGYPNGKKGTEISPEGRITAIVDVFDALVSDRAYKKAFSYKDALALLKNGDERIAPGQFDPDLFLLFISHYDEFVEIHKEFA
ncbi:MAG: HD domain-containing protein [Spirochaetales bacterium]|jgi:HD-GYP domain-containing protein (c-di-GMP phosphodiesterase class II)|nr:HD domain-containing protein [Spirochaetales bacterium]